MSFQAMTWAVEQQLPAMQKLVLLMLANRANHDSGECFPSHKRLATECGMSKDSVKRAIAALEEKGMLTIIRREQDGVNLPNVYRLHLGWSRQPGVGAGSPDGGRCVRPGVGDVCTPNQEIEPGIEPVFTPKPPKPSKPRFDPRAAVLPDCVPLRSWLEWCDHRSRIKKQMTEGAVAKALAFLVEQHLAGDSPAAVIDQAIRNDWQGLFPLKQRSTRNERNWRDAIHDDDGLPDLEDIESIDKYGRITLRADLRSQSHI